MLLSERTKMIFVDVDGTIAEEDSELGCLGSAKTLDELLILMDPVRIAHLKPRQKVIDFVTEVSKKELVVIITGRWEILRDITIAWLVEHKVPHNALLMRPYGAWRQSSVSVKEQLFRDYVNKFRNSNGINALSWVDDDPDMLAAVRKYAVHTVNSREEAFADEVQS